MAASTPETKDGTTRRDLLDRYLQAVLAMSADDLAALYQEDAVHELPFSEGASSVLRGREAIRARYAAAWAASPVRVEHIDVVAVHESDVACVAELRLTLHVAGRGRHQASNVLVMYAENGLLRRVRDYVDSAAIQRALQRPHGLA